MSFGEENAVESVGASRGLMDHRPPSVSERLEQEKKELELRLEAVTSLLEELDSAPGVKSVLDKLSQLGHRVY